MAPKIDWERQVGRRLKLRDLHVFFTVAGHGSMARAAHELGVSQPAISEVIANLEHAVGARLLDRYPQGVEPTIYGRALLKRSVAVFDELKQGIRDIESLSDPTRGELWIGCSESIAAFLSPVVQGFCGQYPRVTLHVSHLLPPWDRVVSELRDRKFDLIVGRRVIGAPTRQDALGEDLNAEHLLDDPLVVAVGMRSPWARRRKIELAELVDEPWILPDSAWNAAGMEEAFREKALDLPKVSLATFSIPLRIDLMATGKFVTALPKSIAERYALKVLPIDLPVRPFSLAIMTLKSRTLSPVVERFIEQVREFTRPMRADNRTLALQKRLGAAPPVITGVPHKYQGT
jgi:DNA-binding transcriptional LysR family regulator